MNTNVNAVARPQYHILTKITRADMGVLLPKLDDPCVMDGPDGSPVPDPVARKKLETNIAKYAHVYTLGGRITGSKVVKGKGDQDGIQFKGQFKAQLAPALGGKWFAAGKCHVPKMYEDILYAALVEAQKDDKAATLEFLVQVGIKPPKPGKPSAVGYEWTVIPLVDTDAADDPVDQLFARASAPALTGPTVGESSSDGAPTGDPATVVTSSESEPVQEPHRSTRRKTG